MLIIEALFEVATEWVMERFGKDRVYAGRQKEIEAWVASSLDITYPRKAEEVLRALEILKLRDEITAAQIEHLVELRRTCTCHCTFRRGSR